MKKWKWIWIGLAVILVVSVLLLSNPQIRTNLFVRLYHDDIEEGLRPSGEALEARFFISSR